ncbi:MAG: GNAT family N-acetyltransferase [Actinomycetota bacterium]|nr:GNAT family N-acetyltransferase [Actinomycetota bacterium]
MKHNYHVQCENVELRPLRFEDIEALRIWRNDAANSRYIRKLPEITPEAQIAWFEAECEDDTSLTFAICVDDELVGSVSLYDITDSSAEFGRLMVGESKGKGIGRKATLATLDIAFNTLHLEIVRAEVSVDNMPALVIYVRVGFCITGKSFNEAAQMDEYKIELDAPRHHRLNDELCQRQETASEARAAD